MQALYAFFQTENKDLPKGEKYLHTSIDKLYELYNYLLLLLIEIKFNANRSIEESKNKLRPTDADLNPNMKFVNNKVLMLIENDKRFQKYCSEKKLNWRDDAELARRILNSFKSSDAYKMYMSNPSVSMQEDKKLIAFLIENYIIEDEVLEHFLEEKSIFWADDFDYCCSMLMKTIDNIKQDAVAGDVSMVLYKNDDDRDFIVDLFNKCVLHDEENEKLISAKTKNWEMDRIAIMDVLLMKMAITEILYLSNVPIKVSLNEYIEISKNFSTPKSKVFINGILDKLVADFKGENRIKKVGRGLME